MLYNGAICKTDMESAVKIASYICQRYERQFGKRIDEMKLHKLLYLTQREAIIQTGEPIFKEQFEAWRYGPVLVAIRQRYKDDALHETLPLEVIRKYEKVFDKVFEEYAVKDSWSLSSITHGEYSWRNARKGVPDGEQSSELISTDDIRKDADRVRNRRILFEKIVPLMKKSV